MFPAYGYNYSFPQTKPQMPSECQHHPMSEGIPPQMKMEASNPPFIYGSWPPHYYGYPVPTPCHSCCNHSNPYPSCYPYRPPYPHFPPPPQCYGTYPVYPESYPFHYASPPHYPMEMPNYEYDKHGSFRCCGCSHPKVNMNGDKGVKIEEHEPEAENREDSLVPAGFKNLQKQPIMWIPPEYIKNQEQVSGTEPRPPLDYEALKKILESDGGGKLQDQNAKRFIKSREKEDVDHHQSVGQQPKFWHDVDGLKKMLQQNQDNGFPFPMIWLPHSNEEKGKMRNEELEGSASETSTRKQSEGHVHSQKIVPDANKAESNEGGAKLVEKSGKPPRTIPVKYMGETTDVKGKTSEDNKPTQKVTMSKPASPAKAAKLPPICLRVDPIPKKKNGQGKPVTLSENKAKGIEDETEKKSTEAPQQKTQVNAVEVEKLKKLAGDENEGKDVREKAPVNAVEVEKPKKLAGDENEGKDVGEKAPSQEVEPKKKILSGTEAATVIQSAYRGYEVRRWEPLKKMRQIVGIKEEADALKRRIESGAGCMDLKQKVTLGETIMSLLLKLDTVQGLHSSVRDFRKSVARELVNLQEMLDTIVLKQPEKGSSQSPDVSEAEAKAGEGQLQTGDDSSMRSGFSVADDQGAVERAGERQDQISSAHNLLVEEESCEPGLLSGEGTLEQEMPEKETEQNECGIVEEVEVKSLAEMSEANKLFQESKGSSSVEGSIKSNDPEPAPVASEILVDSKDQTKMNPYFLEDSTIQTQVEQAVKEDSESSLIEPESNDAESPENVEALSESPVMEPESTDAESPENVKTLSESPVLEPESNVAESPENVKTLYESHVMEPASNDAEPPENVRTLSESPVMESESNDAESPENVKTLSEYPIMEPESDDAESSENDKALFESPAMEPESNEVSKGEGLTDQDAESPENVNTDVEQKTVTDVSVAEPEKLRDSDEASKGRVSVEQDAESPETEQEQKTVKDVPEASVTKLEALQESDDASKGEVLTENVIPVEEFHMPDHNNGNADAKEEAVKLEISRDESNGKEEEIERRVMEENEKMRSLLEKLIASGKEQQEVICSLNEKLKELEGKLAKEKEKEKRKKKGSRSRKARVRMMPGSCRTASNGFCREGQMSLSS